MGFKRSRKAHAGNRSEAARRHDGERHRRRRAGYQIVQSITSFALYGFPESHAASFALLAYASAYLKCHYLAAFTCAMLNNQPMGFYRPATLVKDAQRHGLRVLPVDINRSAVSCAVEDSSLRLGFNYVRGLRASPTANAIVARQTFQSIRISLCVFRNSRLTIWRSWHLLEH